MEINNILSKKDRLALIAQRVIAMKHCEDVTKLTHYHQVDPEQMIKRHRGRPKSIVEDLLRKPESFDYDKLTDDAGVIPINDSVIEEELHHLGTKID